MKTYILALLTASASPCLAQAPAASSTADGGSTNPTAQTLPEPSTAPRVFDYVAGDDKKELTWRRPSEVKFVMLSGCGAGSAGGKRLGTKELPYMTPVVGRAAPVTTVLVGPLNADVYTVTAAAPSDGASSTFVGTDVSIALPGGAGGENASYRGNGADRDGAASAFGPGGKSASSPKDAGAAAVTPCAGGGAPGTQAQAGGNGGPGRLVVYPLPDLQRLLDVLAKVQPPTPPAASTAQSGAP